MCKRIVSVLSAAVIAVSILLMSAAMIPRLFGVMPYGIVSGSMEPVIPVGSLAFIDGRDRSPDIGTIVAFRTDNGQVVTHRVVGTESGGYVTKGDANEAKDPNVLRRDNVLGVYRTHVPLLGFVFLSMPVKIAWAVLLVLAAVLPPVMERKVHRS